jgi:hypothetical protein
MKDYKSEDYKKEFIDTYDLCERIGLDKKEILSSLVIGFYKQQRLDCIKYAKECESMNQSKQVKELDNENKVISTNIKKKSIRKEIIEAIRFVGINKKLSGGWNDDVLEPVVNEIIKILLDRANNMNVAVGAIPLVKNLIWELEEK